MAWRNRAIATLAPLVQRWHGLEERQQRIFTWLALISVSLCVVAFVWLPAMRAHDRMLARLPVLDAQLAQMQRQATEARGLVSQPVTAANVLPAADAGALQSIFGGSAKVSVEANRGFRVVIDRIDYAAWWDRLDEAQSRYALNLAALSLARLPPGGQSVSVDFVLAEPTRAHAGGPGKP